MENNTNVVTVEEEGADAIKDRSFSYSDSEDVQNELPVSAKIYLLKCSLAGVGIFPISETNRELS